MQGARREAAAAAGKDGSGGTAHANYQQWRKRLFEAQRLRSEKADPWAQAGNMLLFHPKAGLRKMLMELCGRGAPGQVVWDAVVRRCRRLSHQAQLASGKVLRAQTRKAVEEAETILAVPADSAATLEKV